MAQKNNTIWRNNSRKHYKLVEGYIFTDLRRLTKLKQ